MKFQRIGATVALTTAVALGMSACATNESSTSGTGSTGTAGSNLSGTLSGKGASSMQAAQDQWIADFQTANSKVTVNYAPDGSGAGRTAFTEGGVDFAGSDRPLKDEEMGAGKFGKCASTSNALNLPVYVSPIALIYNLPGVDLKLDGPTAAGIFKGDIKTWNDPKIAALNPGATLPATAIKAVHRADNSGTTENLTDWFSQNAKEVWDQKPSGDWPYKTGEASQGTSGLVNVIKNTPNTIGYADESQAKGLQVAAIKDGDAFNKPSAEAAAKIVEASPKVEGRAANDWALKLDRTASGYGLILVSYAIVCEEYKDKSAAELVKAYVGYIASPEGQTSGQKASGLAPLSTKMAANVKTAVDAIK